MKLPRLFDPPSAADVVQTSARSSANSVIALRTDAQQSRAADAILRRLEWTTLRRLDGILHGDYRTLLRGVGLDLADLREYQLHDDVRHIDWNVTARMQTPYVRQFSEDRDINAWFLVDLSPSSDFGSGDRNKRDLTIDYVGMMARLLTQHGNRVGVMVYGSTVDTIVLPRADRRHVLRLIHRMTHRPVLGAVGATRLDVLLRRACETLKRRSAVFIVSDFITEDGWQQSLGQLAQRHDVQVTRVIDPLEAELPNVGLMTLEDPETGEQLFVDTTDPALRKRYATMAAARDAALTDMFFRAGVETMPLATNESLIDNVVRFVNLRQRRARDGARARRVAH
jgi:uncharacterized protein (DUF58 family)